MVCRGAAHSGGDAQKKGKLTIQCDELWSFVDHGGNKQWVWLALDADTREIVGVYIGARDEAAARKLWESLLRSIANAPLLTPTFGQRMGQCYRAADIERLEKKRARPVTLSASTIHYGNGCLVQCEKLVFFQIIRESPWCNLVFYPLLQ
jgi:plasmid stabilization system protein ParE